MRVRPCIEADFEALYAIINNAAEAYRGIIPADRWKVPYMGRGELSHEIAAGVVFWCCKEKGELIGVMGLQDVEDVTLIRHAYVDTAAQRRGVGGRLLDALLSQSERPFLVGTWAAAAWAVMRHLGRAGYRASVARLLESVQVIVEGINQIEEVKLMVKPLISVINFTSDSVDMERVFNELSGRGWGSTFGDMNGKARIRLSLNPHRDHEHAHAFVAALKESVQAAR